MSGRNLTEAPIMLALQSAGSAGLTMREIAEYVERETGAVPRSVSGALQRMAAEGRVTRQYIWRVNEHGRPLYREFRYTLATGQ